MEARRKIYLKQIGHKYLLGHSTITFRNKTCATLSLSKNAQMHQKSIRAIKPARTITFSFENAEIGIFVETLSNEVKDALSSDLETEACEIDTH